MKILGNKVLLEKIPQKTVTAAGVILHQAPDWRDDAKQWRVIGVGSGKRVYNKRTKQTHIEPIEVQIGDRVLVDTAILGCIHLSDTRVLVDPETIEMKW